MSEETEALAERKAAWFRRNGMHEQADKIDGGPDDEEDAVGPIKALEEHYTLDELDDATVSAEVSRLRSSAKRMEGRTPEYSERMRTRADALEQAWTYAKYRKISSFEALAKTIELAEAGDY